MKLTFAKRVGLRPSIPKKQIVCISFLIVGVLYTILFAEGCTQNEKTVKANYTFENVNVVPLNEKVILKKRTVAIRNDTIIAIIDPSSETDRVNLIVGERIDGTGQFLMPGLADMHIHLRMDPQAMFNLFLANGVTTIFNMRLGDGGGDVNHTKLRTDIAEGRMTGPRYLISGPQLTPDLLPGVDDVAPMLNRHIEEEYDAIKIHQDLGPEIYNSLITGAHKYGLRVTGHMQHHLPLSESLRMDAIEHMEEFLYTSRDGFGDAAGDYSEFLPLYHSHVKRLAEPEYRKAIVDDVATTSVFVDPTLVIYYSVFRWVDDSHFATLQGDDNLIYLPRETRNKYLNTETNPYRTDDFPFSAEHLESNMEILKTLMYELHEAGVSLLLGTDSFGTLVPGFSIHKELELMVEAGLSPYEALRTGTVNVASYLGKAETEGTIAVGKRADFILLEENPLNEISHTRNVKGVFTQGNWYSDSELASMLEEARKILNSSK